MSAGPLPRRSALTAGKGFRLAAPVVTLCLLAWLVLRIDHTEFLRLLQGVRWQYALLAAGCSLVSLAASSLRWLGVVRSRTDVAVPYATVMRGTLVAAALNSVLPAKSGDLVKALYIKNRTGLGSGLGTVVLERSVDLFVLGLLGLTAGYAAGHAWAGSAGAALLVCVLAATGVFLAVPLDRMPARLPLVTTAGQVRAVYRDWLAHPRCMAVTLLGSAAAWLAGGAAVAALALASGHPLDPRTVYSVFILAVLAGLVPVSVSGIGVRDAAFVVLLGKHMPTEAATFVALGYTACAYWVPALAALLVLGPDLLRYARLARAPRDRRTP
jgi:hypothetical protein